MLKLEQKQQIKMSISFFQFKSKYEIMNKIEQTRLTSAAVFIH